MTTRGPFSFEDGAENSGGSIMENEELTATVVVRGLEDGRAVEFTTATRETAERLVAQLQEQGLTDLTISDLH